MYCSPAALLPAESSKTIEILHFSAMLEKNCRVIFFA
jgi:hypothetical protein